jgi:hypothetical protein
VLYDGCVCGLDCTKMGYRSDGLWERQAGDLTEPDFYMGFSLAGWTRPGHASALNLIS